MIGKKLPGERSNITLLITSIWAIAGTFVLIIGHLSIIYFVYGKIQNINAVDALASAIPVLTTTHLYITAALAIALDIWIIRSQKNARQHKIKR